MLIISFRCHNPHTSGMGITPLLSMGRNAQGTLSDTVLRVEQRDEASNELLLSFWHPVCSDVRGDCRESDLNGL